MEDPTRRFTGLVEDYARYRPSYPEAAVAHVLAETRAGPGDAVADVGAGTGIFTRLLLGRVGTVHAVEPNDAMRAAAEAELGGRPGFVSVKGTAEATGLPAASMAAVVAAQAFHWFRPAEARAEFRRILRPGGGVALLWNERRVDGTPFLEGFEALIVAHCPEYPSVRHKNLAGSAMVKDFLAPAPCRVARFPQSQVFTFAGLRGRLLSSSYAPREGDPGRAPMLADLARLFERHARDGVVEVVYDTTVFTGRWEG